MMMMMMIEETTSAGPVTISYMTLMMITVLTIFRMSEYDSIITSSRKLYWYNHHDDDEMEVCFIYGFDLLEDWSWLNAALETGEETYPNCEPLVAQNPNAFSLSRVLGVSSKSTINHNARTNHAIFISTVAERWGDFCVMRTKHSKSAWSAPFTVERFWSGPVVRSKRFHAARTIS